MAIRVYGDSLDGLAEAAEAIAEKVKQHPLAPIIRLHNDRKMSKKLFEFRFTIYRQFSLKFQHLE